MARGSRPTPFTGSAFARRLAALGRGTAPGTTDAFTQRLSRWFDWTDAIALSAALAPLAAAPAWPECGAAADGEEPHRREAARVRAALRRGLGELPGTIGEGDAFEPWREHIVARQQGMGTAIAALRRRLRTALAAGTPAQARLAALDTVLEQVIAPRERELLATVSLRLEDDFQRRAASPGARRAFYREVLDLLQAELDFRMQPVEGLLSALRPPSHESP